MFNNIYHVGINDQDEIEYVEGNYEPYLRITEVKKVIAYLQKYVKKYKTDEYVEALNYMYYKENEEKERVRSRERALEAKNKTPNQQPCFVYLIVDTFNGCYKIGRTTNIHSRLKQLSNANASISLVKGWHGINQDEKHLHDLFSSKRIGASEWFILEHEDIDVIEDYFKSKAYFLANKNQDTHA